MDELGIAAGVNALVWGVWVTKRIFALDKDIGEVNTKLDLLLGHFGLNKPKDR